MLERKRLLFRQTDKDQTNRQILYIERQTGTHIMQTDRYTERQTDRYMETDRQLYR